MRKELFSELSCLTAEGDQVLAVQAQMESDLEASRVVIDQL